MCLCNDKVVFLFLLQTSLVSWEARHQTLTRLRERRGEILLIVSHSRSVFYQFSFHDGCDWWWPDNIVCVLTFYCRIDSSVFIIASLQATLAPFNQLNISLKLNIYYLASPSKT